MEAISKEHEQWLRENTFECPALKARISLAQCEEIRKRPTIKEFANGEQIHPVKNCRPEECNSCSVWKEFQQEKEKKAQKKGMAVCQKCGKEFKPYKHGAVTVRSICKQCLRDKKIFTRLRNKTNLPFSPDTLWSLLEREGIMEALERKAREEIRTIEQQIVYELKKGVLSSNEL